MRIGFIGLGNMGGPMAGRLLDAGYGLIVHDVRQAAAAPLLARGARWAGSPAGVAAAATTIISIVPSLDTPVCEQQTHYLSEKNNGLDKMVQLTTVSVDTPFAQSRFAKGAKIGNVTFLSDFRGGEFGRTYGLLVKDPHFLARAVMVVDKQNVIRYLQITPELAQLPDLDAAFRAARALLAAG
jgi:peroxiredoxin